MKKYVNGKYIDYTEEELAEQEHFRREQAAQEKHRQLTFSEVSEMLLRKQINDIDIEDQTAVRMLAFYPAFADVVGQEVKQGFKFTHSGKLYKVIQPTLTISSEYLPGEGTESLYEVINEEYDGDIYDPIPYDGNMALGSGKYYTQDNVVYLCTRDTENAVYNALSELVGLYVEVA